jgi:hypothetical protein
MTPDERLLKESTRLTVLSNHSPAPTEEGSRTVKVITAVIRWIRRRRAAAPIPARPDPLPVPVVAAPAPGPSKATYRANSAAHRLSSARAADHRFPAMH